MRRLFIVVLFCALAGFQNRQGFAISRAQDQNSASPKQSQDDKKQDDEKKQDNKTRYKAPDARPYQAGPGDPGDPNLNTDPPTPPSPGSGRPSKPPQDGKKSGDKTTKDDAPQ